MDSPTLDSREIVAMETNTLTPELRDKVFNNEMIQDRIFDYVFTSDNKNIRTCGLVEHSWLDYVTDRLQKATKPREHLSFLHWEKSNEVLKSAPKHFQVQNFLDIWATFPGAGRRIPLFNLNFSRQVNATIKRTEVQDLITCLMRCGNGLHSLELDLLDAIDYGLNDALIRKDFGDDLTQLAFPRLKSLSFKVCPLDKDNRLFTLLLPPIFLGCKRLTHLFLRGNISNEVPVSRLSSEDGKSEYLPETLEIITIDALMTSQLLSTLLLENSLLNLTELRLTICKQASNEGVVFSILDRFSRKLKSFAIGYNWKELQKESTFIRFPVMTKLKEMSITSFHSQLEPGMEQSFPVLETFELHRQSSTIMRKWTENFQFSCVTDLNIEFNEIENVEWSQELHVSFPQLQKLRLSFSGRVKARAFRNIFQHMTQLRQLSINLRSTEETFGSSTWDAILLGVSREYAKYLVQSPRELWDSINLSHIRSSSRSIVNLSNLTRFSLYADEYEYGYKDMDDLYVSDVSFHFAFLRMPNLLHLYLNRGFGASAEMVEEWRRRGREFDGYECDELECSLMSEEEQDV